MKLMIHKTASIIATLCVATFFISTLMVEFFGTEEMIVLVKSLIVMPGIFILVIMMALTGATGFALAKNRKGEIVQNKKRRMPIIAMTGIFILIPAAIYLNNWASAGLFDTRFYIVQAIELLAGATNLILMIKSIQDGKKLRGKKSINRVKE